MTFEGAADEETVERHIELEVIEALSLDDALSIIGESTRAKILLTLGEARTTDPTEPNAMAFSELMQEMDIRDSGRFNYHLEKLLGTFIEKTDDGYSLRFPGLLMYQSIVAGTLTDRRTIEPFPVGTCPNCQGELTAGYHPDHLLTVECTACGMLFDSIHFPARGLTNRENMAILDAAYRRRHHKVAAMREGVCQHCGSEVERSLRTAASLTYGSNSLDEMAGLDIYAVLECTGCTTSLVGHPTNIALTTMHVTGLFAEHGRDIANVRWWEPPISRARQDITITVEDSPAVTIPFHIEDDRLTIVMNEDLRVTDAERDRP